MRYLLLILMISVCAEMYSQDKEISEPAKTKDSNKTSGYATSENLMDDEAYRKMVIEDLNFLVIGDNNPKQGLAYTLNSDKTQLDLTGNIKWGEREQPIINLTGSFSTADGVFLLDDKDGAKKGKLTVDVFWTTGIGNKSKFWGPNSKNGKGTSLAILQKASLDTEYLKSSRADSLTVMKIIASEFDIPYETLKNDKNQVLRQNRINSNRAAIHISDDRSLYIATLLHSILTTYLDGELKTKFSTKKIPDLQKSLKNNTSLIDLSGIDPSMKKEVTILTWENDGIEEKRIIYKDFKTNKFIADFKKLEKRNSDKFLKKEKNELQITNADSLWTNKKLFYFGISTFYEREFLNIYEPKEGVTDLSKLFQEERGNLYGLIASANYYINWRNGAYLHLKGTAGLNRISNFSDFTLTNFVSTQTAAVSDDGSTLEQVTEGTGYLSNDHSYRFTSSKTVAFDFYAGYETFGLFGRIGLRDDNFANVSATIPFQAGLVLNFKGKEKEIISLLLFVDRQNLKLQPDGDTNLGFRVGLPFNLKGKSKS